MKMKDFKSWLNKIKKTTIKVKAQNAKQQKKLKQHDTLLKSILKKMAKLLLKIL